MRLRALSAAARSWFWTLRDRARQVALGTAHTRRVFERIHDGNLWDDPESRSGRGSNRAATDNVRRELPRLLRDLGVRRLLDAPCGDFEWMRHIATSVDVYVGVDIVPALIQRNSDLYGAPGISFLCADITTDPLPAADLVLCRDCFFHLPTRLIRQSIQNFARTGARYLLVTNHPKVREYRDIAVGSFRPVNLERPPFGFPPPIARIAESGDEERQLSLWELSTLCAIVPK